jgi:two-component system, NarL family, response regulator NreC
MTPPARGYLATMPPHLHLAPSPAGTGSVVCAASPIRVVLAEGHALMRRGLRLLLDIEDGVEVIAEADDVASALRHVHGYQPHVLVLDLGMPGGSSIETIGKLRERAPDIKIVVLTMDDSPVFAQRALAAGALGFVVKHLADSELAQAVRAAAHGEEYVGPRVAARLGALRRSLTDKLTRARSRSCA